LSTLIFHTGLTPPNPISANGLKVVHTPVIQVCSEYDHEPHSIQAALSSVNLILLMSKNAVDGLKNWLGKNQLSISFFKNLPFWTVGVRTGNYLKRELGASAWYPQQMTGDGVIQSLLENNHTSILLISAKHPRNEFLESLTENKITFFHFPVYHTQMCENEEFSQQFSAKGNSSVIVFTSPSTVQGTLNSLSIPNFTGLDCKLVSIGPTTSGEIEHWGGEIYYESKYQDIDKLYSELAALENIDE
jgi:uroporphyrinogen-III synthase